VLSIFALLAVTVGSATTQTDNRVALPLIEQGRAITLPALEPSEVRGDIYSAGSSATFFLVERMAEVFDDAGYYGQITVDSIGSGGGFERFCVAAATDISHAVRPINEEEAAVCAALQPPRYPIEFRVGTQAVAVVVSKQNTFLQQLSLQELYVAFAEADTWDELDPHFPSDTIWRIIPDSDSTAFEYFVDEVLYEDDEVLLKAPYVSQSTDEDLLVDAIYKAPNGIGFVNYSTYLAHRDKLRALVLEDIAPTAANIENTVYRLSRPLFIYSDRNIMREKPQVAAFINYFLSNVNREITSIGYTPVSTSTLNNAKKRWLEAME
jgi:phosphate transport system substrate-binding protein